MLGDLTHGASAPGGRTHWRSEANQTAGMVSELFGRSTKHNPTSLYSIEQKITKLHASKRNLADSLLEGADMSGKLSAEALLKLVRE